MKTPAELATELTAGLRGLVVKATPTNADVCIDRVTLGGDAVELWRERIEGVIRRERDRCANIVLGSTDTDINDNPVHPKRCRVVSDVYGIESLVPNADEIADAITRGDDA